MGKFVFLSPLAGLRVQNRHRSAGCRCPELTRRGVSEPTSLCNQQRKHRLCFSRLHTCNRCVAACM